MFLPVKSDFSNVSTDKFLKLKFANKGIDTLNIGNILNHKEVTKHIPAYFKCPSERCIYRASRPSHGTVNWVAVSK